MSVLNLDISKYFLFLCLLISSTELLSLKQVSLEHQHPPQYFADLTIRPFHFLLRLIFLQGLSEIFHGLLSKRNVLFLLQYPWDCFISNSRVCERFLERRTVLLYQSVLDILSPFINELIESSMWKVIFFLPLLSHKFCYYRR